MKLKLLVIITLIFSLKSFSQSKQKVLFTIENEPIYTQDFINVYKKNLKIASDSKTNLHDYLQLYINYKLKVKEAKNLSLDTVQKFKNELARYKKSLTLPYLKDKSVSKKLIQEAYNRLKKEVNVSHILIFLKPDATPKDTLEAYTKLIEARKLIQQGADFSEVAKKYSKDPTVFQNGGKIGYFTVFQMVYPFENMAYSTKVGNVSMPFRTRFGYHILKVNDIRDSKGEVEVAHIMIKLDSINSKRKIDSIYHELKQNKADFAYLAKKLSDDKASAIYGGKLPKFGSGRMVESFAKVAFSLNAENEISKPFKTKYGWHIIQLIKKYPIESFDNLKNELAKKINNDKRSNLISKTVIDRLLKQLNVIVYDRNLERLKNSNWKDHSEKFNENILKIDDKLLTQQEFINYLKLNPKFTFQKAFEKFKEIQIVDYYKLHIETLNAEFAATFKDFKEGMLLFDLLEGQVWEKAKDSVALEKYYNLNKTNNYTDKKFNKIKGQVIADYQNYLEKRLIEKLRKKYSIVLNKKEYKRIKKIKF